MIIGRSSTQCVFFYADQKSKMATTAGHRLTLDPMGKYRNIFFFEAIALIEPNLCINHWKVLYKFNMGWAFIFLDFTPLFCSG